MEIRCYHITSYTDPIVSDLVLCLNSNHIEGAKIRIENGEYRPVNEGTDYPLHIACSKGFIDVVRMMIDRGAYIYTHGEVLLRNAVGSRCIELVQLLIEAGVDIQADGCNAFYKAILQGNLEIVKLFINTGISINKEGDELMFIVCINGYDDIAKLLLSSYSSDINIELVTNRVLHQATMLLNVCFLYSITNGSVVSTHYNRIEIIKLLQIYYWKTKENQHIFMNVIKHYPLVNDYINNYMKNITIIQRVVKDYLYKPAYKDGSPGIMITKQLKQ